MLISTRQVRIAGSKWRQVHMLQFYASMMYVRRDADDMPPARQGVKREIKLENGTRIANDNLWLFRGGRLFQQFVCTAAARVELKRMSTLQTPRMQKQLRAETYADLREALRSGSRPDEIGRRVVCPASVKGSRRAMCVQTCSCLSRPPLSYSAPHHR